MYLTLYPEKDTTLDSQFPEKNMGVDQLLYLKKNAIGDPSLSGDDTVFYDQTFNSRVLIKFDLTDVSRSIANGKITGDNWFYLTLKATEATALPLQYTLWAYPVSGSWINGTGFFNNNPQRTDGASWYYRNSKLDGLRWISGSYNQNSTGSYVIGGGGNWFTSSYASQSFSFESPDVRMDVSSIVKQWISGSIPNEGFILKLHDSEEFTSQSFGEIQWFAVNSHTIYLPRLEVFWKNIDHSGTSSFSEINDEEMIVRVKNLKESYSNQEKPIIRLQVRENYPVQTYGTSSAYQGTKRLPINSYFQIQDVVTDDILIPFHPSGTMINCDSNGNYFKADISCLMPERKYKFVIRSEFDNGDTIKIIDDNYYFGVKRN